MNKEKDVIKLNLRKSKLDSATAVKELPFEKRVWELSDFRRSENGDHVLLKGSTGGLSLEEHTELLNYAEDLKCRAAAKQAIAGTQDKSKQRNAALNYILRKNVEGDKSYTTEYFGLDESERNEWLDELYASDEYAAEMAAR